MSDLKDRSQMRAMHVGFLAAEHTSSGQRLDSQLIIALLDENHSLREQLKHWEDQEIDRAVCCMENEQRAVQAEKERDAARAEAERMKRALAAAAIPLEALNMVGTEPFCVEVRQAIADGIREIRQALSPASGTPVEDERKPWIEKKPDGSFVYHCVPDCEICETERDLNGDEGGER